MDMVRISVINALEEIASSKQGFIMVETAIIVVPTLWKREDERKLAMDPWEQKAVLDHVLHEEHYRVKQMNIARYCIHSMY